jgi:hypothetical protein
MNFIYLKLMQVYVTLYNPYDGDGRKCYGVFTNKDSAEDVIMNKIAERGNDQFTHINDRWFLKDEECVYRIETCTVERLTINLYIVLYESFDAGAFDLCGVFTTKQLAENKIMNTFTIWGDDFTFRRTNDRWVLERGEVEYRIETHMLNGLTLDIKEPCQ